MGRRLVNLFLTLMEKVGASIDKNPNPHELIWYRQGWSKTRIEKNNAKYWEFEIEHNGLTLP